MLWLLTFAPVVLVAEHLGYGSPMVLFVLYVLAIVPLVALTSSATESVTAKAGDRVGGMLNATLGDWTDRYTSRPPGMRTAGRAKGAGE